MPDITFTEAIGGPVPAVEIEINLSGSGGLPDGDQIRSILIVAEGVAAGTLAVDTVSATAFGSEADGVAAFGTTSPGAAMVAAVYDYYNSESGAAKCEVWGARVTENAGGTAAEQDYTIVGVSSAAGVITQRIGGKLFRTSISNAMAIADQATAIRDTFNNSLEKDRPPLLASAAAGVVTYTATVKGAHMNNIALETVSTGSIGTSTYTWENETMGGAAPGTPGLSTWATANFDTLIAALTSFNSAGQYVIPWTEDGLEGDANIVFDTVVPDLFLDHIISQSDATNMIPATLRMAWKCTVAKGVAAIAAFDTSDAERASLAVMPYADDGMSGCWEGEIVARYAAMRASERHYGRSFDGLAFSEIAPASPADNYTRAEMTTLINGGCTPLYVPVMEDTVKISRDVSCRMDFGVLDTQAMDALDYIRSDFEATLKAQNRLSIVEDDADLPPVEFITQPKVIKGLLRSRADMLAKAGYMTNVAALWPNVVVNLDGSTLQLSVPVALIPALHNIMVRMDATVPPGA